MAGEETKQTEQSAQTSSATEKNETPTSAGSSDGAPLSRKRTRDDFEADNKEEAELEERKIAPLKRRKSVTETSKDESALEEVKKIDAIAEASKEGTVEIEDPQAATTTTTEEEKKEEKEEKEEQEQEQEPVATQKDENPSIEDKTEGSSKETLKEETPKSIEAAKPTTTPRFVFGANTAFGGKAFSMINKKTSLFDAPSSTSTSTAATKSSSAPVFGSGSSFGNAFRSAIGKKSIFDKDEDSKADSPVAEGDENNLEASNNTHLYKQVDLEKKEIKSGEENEEQVFTCRAKLYALDLTNVQQGWKERGVGNIHVNKSKEIGKSSRIIMRSNGLLKVILNTALVQGLEVVKGMPSSMSSEKFIRITSVEDSKPIQYAIKTGSVETTEAMFNIVTDLIPQEV